MKIMRLILLSLMVSLLTAFVVANAAESDQGGVHHHAQSANDNSESKMMMRMGDWYMAGYDLEHGGKHQLMVLFKTADGTKQFGGVLFPQN